MALDCRGDIANAEGKRGRAVCAALRDGARGVAFVACKAAEAVVAVHAVVAADCVGAEREVDCSGGEGEGQGGEDGCSAHFEDVVIIGLEAELGVSELKCLLQIKVASVRREGQVEDRIDIQRTESE